MTGKTFLNPIAFKQALEQRLKNMSENGAAFARKRQLLVFDRFLARILSVFREAVLLKGGLVLEIRLKRARTTKDVDLRMMGSPDDMLSKLQEAGRINMGDFMTFEINSDRNHPKLKGDGVLYEGYRYRGECKLAGKLYGQPFGIDVAFGDPVIGKPDVVFANDVLEFAGISPPALPLYPVETHIAEKLHAYTMPRNRPNTRVKDLPDIALLATSPKMIDAQTLHAALLQTFSFRKTHSVPDALPIPLEAWRIVYESMAQEDKLQWATLDELTHAVQKFLNPVLLGRLNAKWVPTLWDWKNK